jgi:hypothetical protein
VLAIAGCGGARQDANEPSGTFPVAVTQAQFTPSQQVASSHTLTISVRNTGHSTVPNVAVTINSFNYVDKEPGLAVPERPVWIVNSFTGTSSAAPGAKLGGVTAYTNTWALGRLAPGEQKVFRWHVTAIQPGRWRVGYRVAAGLNGKAVAQLANGRPPTGAFNVVISGTPQIARVDPNTGRVVQTNQSAPVVTPK